MTVVGFKSTNMTIAPGEEPDSIVKHLPRWLKGNAGAIEFIITLFSIAEAWDDAIDRDKSDGKEETNAALYGALVALPRCGFYQQNFARLNPLIESSIYDWLTANDFEAHGDKDRLPTAYGLRSNYQSIIVICASIIGGCEWACHVSKDLYSRGDSLSMYKSELEIFNGKS